MTQAQYMSFDELKERYEDKNIRVAIRFCRDYVTPVLELWHPYKMGVEIIGNDPYVVSLLLGPYQHHIMGEAKVPKKQFTLKKLEIMLASLRLGWKHARDEFLDLWVDMDVEQADWPHLENILDIMERFIPAVMYLFLMCVW